MPYSNSLVETVEIRSSHRRARKRRADMRYPFNLPQARWFRNGVPPTRDSFRERTYKAEAAVCSKWQGQKFSDIREARYFIRHFIESAWFQARFPYFTNIVVEYNPRMRHAIAGPRLARRDLEGEKVATSGKMTIGRECLVEQVILHELAHAVLPFEHYHDRRWLRTYLEFVRSSIGEGSYQALRTALKERKLRYAPWRRGGGAPPAQLRMAAARARRKS